MYRQIGQAWLVETALKIGGFAKSLRSAAAQINFENFNTPAPIPVTRVWEEEAVFDTLAKSDSAHRAGGYTPYKG